MIRLLIGTRINSITLIMTKVVSILVTQNVGKVKEDLQLPNTIILKLVNIGRKNVIFDLVMRQNLIDIQGDNVSFCVDLTCNDLTEFEIKPERNIMEFYL
jgi:hypothetical protein